MSIFDPDAFANQTTNEAGSTTFEPIPQGEYRAMIESVKPREVNGKEGPRVVLDVVYNLQDPEVAAKLGREKLTIRSGIFLDLNSSGGMDMGKGKNVGLNKLRDACGLNTPGKPFNVKMLEGQAVKVQVTLRPDKNSDAIYNDVRSVGKLG